MDPCKCGRCGGSSHELEKCPAKDYYCHICAKTGHYLEFCISPINDSISKIFSNNVKPKGCKHCGTSHAYRNCPAYNSKCDMCHGKGHFTQFCQSMKQGSSKGPPKANNRSGTSTPVVKAEPLKNQHKQENGCEFKKMDTTILKNFKRRESGSSSEKSIKELPKNKETALIPPVAKNIIECNKCGTSHAPDKCSAKNSYCSICKRNGHFEECCIFKDKNKGSKSDPPIPQKKKECKKCGKNHSFDECPAKNSLCSCCKKPGHFDTFCKFKNAATDNSDCGKCGGSHDGSICPAKNEYCKNCHLQGHFTQCCKIPTAEKIEEWKRDEQNALCRFIFTTAKEDYGRNASGPVLEKRKQEAIEIRQKQIERTLKEQKKAKNLELCFLLDATKSMKDHIAAVKKSINDIVDCIIQPQANMSQYGWANRIRLAVIAYRDFGDIKQFEWLNNGKFTESIQSFKNFCENLDAFGGGDAAEDVLGGLDKALSLDWNNEYGTKVIYHITDAPCHGKKFHNLKKEDDKYYDLGHPNGLTDKTLFSKLRKMKIQYSFGKISNNTDKMIEVFSQSYGREIKVHDIKRVENILESVLSAVSMSITTKVSEAAKMVSLSEKSDERKYKIVKKEPKWNKINEISVTFLNYELMESIDDIIQREFTLPLPLQFDSIKIAPNPFAKGGDRLAYYGKALTKNGIKDQVFKEYLSLSNKDNISINYKIPNEISTIASFFAQKFCKKIKNAIGDNEPRLSFLKIKNIRIREKDKNGKEKIRYLCAENRFRDNDKFHKFTNNATFSMTEANAKNNGINLKFIEMLLAFSHFTYQESNAYLMIVDLQGVMNHNGDGSNKFILTDPSIHCKNLLRFGKTNFGEKGMKNFFDQHQCNSYCQRLGFAFDNKK